MHQRLQQTKKHRPKQQLLVSSHTLQYQHTAVRGINLPEFTVVGLLDGEPFVYYDSNITKMIPKTEWIKNISNDDPDYWKRETQRVEGQQDSSHTIMDQLFNHTEGVHTVQRMYGCECDDDGTTRGYDLFGYDGEDFMSLDLKNGTWTAMKPQAGELVKKWDAQSQKSYLENECIDRLKKFVSCGNATLERKVLPKVSVFQKHSLSPEVVCHATGFFPKALNITWQKDGENIELHVLNETLPNHDGTFQKRSILKVSTEELEKHNYTCVVQHSSLEKELVLPVSERRILRDGGSDGGKIGFITGCVALGVAVIA
ncbi:H-2 class I histocompatibility antigen, Q9 alpha chain-like, partial [Neoarius graeffei]|uniref:H-2 class I histocompatibility antigen, Q9 alpha chain-like n=1 Tax=Neoarius graeffei TaxID=443677 RepID=UPI00298D1BDC